MFILHSSQAFGRGGAFDIPVAAPACGGYFAQYVDIRFREAAEILKREGGEEWIFDGDKGPSYNSTFGGFWTRGDFVHLLAERRAANLNNHILDLMGSAVFTDPTNKNVDSLTGARLKSLKKSSLPVGFPNPKWQEVTGNLYSRQVWNQIDARLEGLDREYFDVILARPEGGLVSQGASLAGIPAQYKSAADMILIARAYALLSSDNGQLFFQFERVPGNAMNDWLVQLSTAGIEYDIIEHRGKNYPAMTIKKTRESPAALPLPWK